MKISEDAVRRATYQGRCVCTNQLLSDGEFLVSRSRFPAFYQGLDDKVEMPIVLAVVDSV